MIAALGLALTIAGAGGSIVGVLAAVRAVQGRWPPVRAQRAALSAFAALLAANIVMVIALVAHDYSISYVAQVGSNATPLLFTIASLWGALEGSILFWAALLAGMAVLLVVRTRTVDDRSRLPGALAVLLALTAFFALIVVGPGNPWARVTPVPLDGPGPNPLLQDHPLMAFHPPLLYLGFVGLAIPFALTVDALVAGRVDDRWLLLVRRWTLGPWVLLTLGLFAGAWWSYAVLGWGGYWGWDPVENVALLPWLTSTAFLHSAMVGRRGGALFAWNIALIAASFALTIFATLVTRSGVLDSVHAFTRSAIGPLFVGLLGAVLVGTVGLLLVRLPDSTVGGRLGTRGRAFLLNNMLLAAIAATVLVGTVFPLLAEAFGAGRLSVGAPYFERVVGPVALGLLVLVGVGPTLPWGDWSARSRAGLVPGALAAGFSAAGLIVLGSDAGVIAGVAAGVFTLVQSAVMLGRRIEPAFPRLRAVPRQPRSVTSRSVGGLLSHVGIGVLALAVVASSSGKRESVVTLRPGESTAVVGRTVTYLGKDMEPAPNRTVVAARLNVGGSTTELRPSLSVFATSTQAIASPAIVPGLTDDLYVTLLDMDTTTGLATLRIGTHPFVSWIWAAGALIALGGVMTLAPIRIRRRHTQSVAVEPRPLFPSEALDVVRR